MWCGRESNPRHEDFQSSALPTELPHLSLQGWAKVVFSFIYHKFFRKNLFTFKLNQWKMAVNQGLAIESILNGFQIELFQFVTFVNL